jgi:hypothetical protein
VSRSSGDGAPSQPSAAAIGASESIESAEAKSSAASRRVRTRRCYARRRQRPRPLGCDRTQSAALARHPCCRAWCGA